VWVDWVIGREGSWKGSRVSFRRGLGRGRDVSPGGLYQVVGLRSLVAGVESVGVVGGRGGGGSIKRYWRSVRTGGSSHR